MGNVGPIGALQQTNQLPDLKDKGGTGVPAPNAPPVLRAQPPGFEAMRADAPAKEGSATAEKVKQVAEGASKLLDGIKTLEENKAGISRALGKVADSVGASKLSDGVAKPIINAVDRGQSGLYKLNVVDAKGFKALDGAASFLSGAADARARGASPVAAVLDGAVTAAIKDNKEFEAIDKGAAAVQTAANALSPTLGKVTKVLTDSTPGKTLQGLATGAIDTADGILHGDVQRVIHNMQQGRYCPPLQGYGQIIGVAQAAITGDRSITNRISDEASSGKLGNLAKVGDSIGDRASQIFPLPLSIIHKYF